MNTKEYTYGNALIRIHRPNLTNDERARVEQHMQNTLNLYGRLIIDAKEKNNGNKNTSRDFREQ